MAGLEDVDIPGREYLKETLTNCADPLKAIAEFQEENGKSEYLEYLWGRELSRR